MRPVTEFEFFVIMMLVAFALIVVSASLTVLHKRITALEDRFKPLRWDVNQFQQEDEIVLTGVANDGKRYVGLAGMIATVSDKPGAEALKVWPDAYLKLPHDRGKLWFMFKDIDDITVIRKSDLV